MSAACMIRSLKLCKCIECTLDNVGIVGTVCKMVLVAFLWNTLFRINQPFVAVAPLVLELQRTIGHLVQSDPTPVEPQPQNPPEPPSQSARKIAPESQIGDLPPDGLLMYRKIL